MTSPSSQIPSTHDSPNHSQRRPPSRRETPEQPPNNRNATIPDDEHGADLPLTMSASVVLTSLPRDAHQALADAEAIDTGKVTVRFQPLASAPILKTRVFKISASQKFETVVSSLRKKLGCKPTDSVFCYVNSVFAPGLDEGVGGLWRCFKTDDQLIVAYSMTPAFG
ncbi:ubiquitin-like autophagy protein Apg12-domain-containing protein [Aspergillus egyptiacus]|nr:ubiquitin-like autophagy protein Apg12-domain-containing protein [Aspergillus egyptiacus]